MLLKLEQSGDQSYSMPPDVDTHPYVKCGYGYGCVMVHCTHKITTISKSASQTSDRLGLRDKISFGKGETKKDFIQMLFWLMEFL